MSRERDHKDQKFRDQLGITATVQREELRGESEGQANRDLLIIGSELNPKAEHLRHMGSAAFHIYWNETLKQVFFVHQAGATLNDCPERLAQVAVKDFVGTILEQYGHRRPKLRSGF